MGRAATASARGKQRPRSCPVVPAGTADVARAGAGRAATGGAAARAAAGRTAARVAAGRSRPLRQGHQPAIGSIQSSRFATRGTERSEENLNRHCGCVIALLIRTRLSV